ncbi:MAG: GNAT family N-acetyltransferase [Actinomycetota bacterium]|nr:GNAT family N-acetyltransferase [Actinomycetota bacterium]
MRHDAESARLDRIYVRAPFRRRGIATSLVGELISLARQLGYHRVLLEVMVARTEAVRLYERLGFRSAEPYATHDVPMQFMGLDLCDLRTSGQE